MDSTNFQPSFAVPPILLRHQRSYARQCTASSSSSNSSGSSRRNTRTPKAFSWFEGSTQGIFRTKKSQPEENTVTSGTVEAAQPPPPAPVEEEYVETDQERRDRERVEYMAAKLFQNSPMIRFMTRQLKLVGCDPYHQVDPSDRTAIPRLAIQSCPDENTAGGFTPSQEKGQHYSNAGIVICADRILNKQHLEDTLAHEMIHWWDHCRFRVDWKDLRQIACSEIRAASLSGDCRYSMETTRSHRNVFKIIKHHQECVRRRAALSLTMNTEIPVSQEKAERLVDEVWENCFKDTRPFDEIY